MCTFLICMYKIEWDSRAIFRISLKVQDIDKVMDIEHMLLARWITETYWFNHHSLQIIKVVWLLTFNFWHMTIFCECSLAWYRKFVTRYETSNMAKRYLVTHELHNMRAYTNHKLCQLTHYTLLVLRELANNCYNFSRI